MRVYISGAISNEDDYKQKFAKAEKELKAKGYDVINPTVLDAFENLSYEEYMTLDLCLLEICDTIYMLNGWEKSCGANREYGYALAKGHIVMLERGDSNDNN